MAAVSHSPTFAPTGTYVPPPSHVVTHFTPAPSCSPDKLWLVSTQGCSMSKNDYDPAQPSWAECALTLAGDPRGFLPAEPSCYAGPNLRDDEGNSVFISECPVGYTQVHTSARRAHDRTTWITVGDSVTSRVDYKDVVEHGGVCCPDNQYGGFKYNYYDPVIDYIRTTDPAGKPASIFLYVPPRCVATSVCNVPPTVTLDAVYNPNISDKKRKRQQEIPYVGVVTRAWNSKNVLFAHSISYQYTVFHGTYTCFEDCYNYYTSSYDNTDPSLPSTTLGPLRDFTSKHVPNPKCVATPTSRLPSPPIVTGNASGHSTPSTGHGGHGYNATFTGGYSTGPNATGGSGGRQRLRRD